MRYARDGSPLEPGKEIAGNDLMVGDIVDEGEALIEIEKSVNGRYKIRLFPHEGETMTGDCYFGKREWVGCRVGTPAWLALVAPEVYTEGICRGLA